MRLRKTQARLRAFSTRTPPRNGNTSRVICFIFCRRGHAVRAGLRASVARWPRVECRFETELPLLFQGASVHEAVHLKNGCTVMSVYAIIVPCPHSISEKSQTKSRNPLKVRPLPPALAHEKLSCATSLVRNFSPQISPTAAITSRLRNAVFDKIEPLGRLGILKPPPMIPLIARGLGHQDSSILEAELRGDRPLSFADGDRLCKLFGLSRSWLESGGGAYFSTTARYQDSREALHDFIAHGIEYDWLYFVLKRRSRRGRWSYRSLQAKKQR